MSRCEKDALKKCIIGVYWYCRDCEKYPSIDKSKQFQRVHGKKELTGCIMCAIVEAESNSHITTHHVIPNSVSSNHLHHKIGVTVKLCFNHHKLLHVLLEPYDDILKAKGTYQSRKELTDYFLYMKLPELVKRINNMVMGIE